MFCVIPPKFVASFVWMYSNVGKAQPPKVALQRFNSSNTAKVALMRLKLHSAS